MFTSFSIEGNLVNAIDIISHIFWKSNLFFKKNFLGKLHVLLDNRDPFRYNTSRSEEHTSELQSQR